MQTKVKSRLITLWLILGFMLISALTLTIIYAEIQKDYQANVGIKYETPFHAKNYLRFTLNEETDEYSVTGPYDNTTITDVIIPKTYLGKPVTSIGEQFLESSNLDTIYIPNTIKRIEQGALKQNDIESITVEEGNPYYYSVDNCLIERATKTLIVGCKNSIIPTDGSVTSIGAYAFSGRYYMYSMNIPSCITEIGEGAFSYSFVLNSITLPPNITKINDKTFYYCASLTEITIPSGVTSIGSYAFSYCEDLTEITIPSNVNFIGAYAFYNCSNLTSAVFENTSGWSNEDYNGNLGTKLKNSATAATMLSTIYNNAYYLYRYDWTRDDT